MAKTKSKKTGSSFKSLMPLFAGVAAAVFGLVMMQNYVDSEKSRIRESMHKDQICVLTVNNSLEIGDAVSPDQFGYRSVSKEEQPWSSIKFEDPESSVDARRRYEDLVTSLTGQTVNRNVPQGDILLWTDLQQEQFTALGDILDEDQRAVSIEVDRASVMSGLLQPNDRVDVLATYQEAMDLSGSASPRNENVSPTTKTKIVLKDITVLAVGSTMARVDRSRRLSGNSMSVVLALTPDQAMVLSYVQKAKRAQMSLLLRPRSKEAAGEYSQREISGDLEVQEIIDRLTKEESDGAL